MSKQIIKNYVFNAAAKTITLPDFTSIDSSRLALITNTTSNTIVYNFADPAKNATISGNVITLSYNTTGMSNSDSLRIDYNTAYGDVAYDRVTVGNARTKFRDGFASSGITQPNPDVWLLEEDVPGTHIINQGGDSAGSSYLRISLSPFIDSNGLKITSKKSFQFPMRVGFGISASQRILGQEFFAGMVATDASGAVPADADVPDKAITGATISVTSNVGTVTLTNHGLKGGDRVNIFGNADKRMNVGPVVVTVVDANNFTVPITITNGSYSSVGGMVRLIDPLRNVRNGAGFLWENTTVTNASLVSRRNGAKFRTVNNTTATTTATQSNTSPYTDAFNAAGNQELYLTMDEVGYRSYTSDGTATMSGLNKFTQGVPDEELEYKIQIRARNLAGMTKPVARVVSASKSGTTTATVTTDVAHGLVAGDFVQIYGTRDQTNFAQLSTQTVIASVPTSTTFTVVWGSAVTASTTGGVVWINHGQVAAPGVIGQSVQSVSRTNNVLTVVGNTTWSGPLPGEYVQVHGLESAASSLEGAYKVLRINGTALELESTGADVASVNTGGAVIRRTDVRLHFARVMDYTRLGVEVLGGRGNTSDINNAAPVSITGSAQLGVNATQTTGVNSTIWNSAGWGGFLVADIISAAITTTTTSSAVTPGSVANIGTYSHTFNVVVTAVSGTTPTLDVAIEESPDNGTNWIRIYEFPRITAAGSYVSPKIRATYGTRFRYVRTVAGTTPSFTMAINRIQWSTPGELTRQWFDRSIAVNTLNSTTPVYTVDGANFFHIVTNMGAITTTAPAFTIQGSEDGTNWYNMGANITTTANSTAVTILKDFAPKFLRLVTSTAGSGATLGYISVKALGA